MTTTRTVETTEMTSEDGTRQARLYERREGDWCLKLWAMTAAGKFKAPEATAWGSRETLAFMAERWCEGGER